MKNYIVKSLHEVFVDNYNDGEGNYVNSYVLSDEVQAGNPIQAVEKYMQDYLGYNLDFANCEISECRGYVRTSCLVDVENNQPSTHQFEQWKTGGETLYANMIDISVSEVIEVRF